ncbi:MAG TPA: YkvA family protein [Salinimicrobium sp.]|nr:YkvA family protein [Salinimicrobium sp.]
MKEDKETVNEEFLRDELNKIDKEDIDAALRKEKEVSKKIDDVKMLNKYKELGKTMFGMLRDFSSGTYKDVPWLTISAIAFSLLYVLNPLDIMPDFIPGLGYIDDLAVFTYAIKFIETDLHKYLDWKLEDNNQKLQES